MGQFLNSINEVRKNYTKYDEWEQKQADERAQKEYLAANLEIPEDKLELTNKRAQTVIRATEIMDARSEDNCENMEQLTGLLSSIPIFALTFAQMPLINFTEKKLTSKYYDKVKKINEEIQKGGLTRDVLDAKLKEKSRLLEKASKITKKVRSNGPFAVMGLMLATAVGMILWSNSKQKEASRIGRYQAKQNELKGLESFVVYTPEQIEKAKEIAKNIPDEKERNSISKMIKELKDVAKDKKAYEEWLSQKDPNEIEKLKSVNLTSGGGQLQRAQEDKELIVDAVKEINIKAEEYSENVENAFDTLGTLSWLIAAPVGLGINKILKALKVNPKIRGIVSVATPLTVSMTLSMSGTVEQKQASRVGRYKARKDLLKNPARLMAFSEDVEAGCDIAKEVGMSLWSIGSMLGLGFLAASVIKGKFPITKVGNWLTNLTFDAKSPIKSAVNDIYEVVKKSDKVTVQKFQKALVSGNLKSFLEYPQNKKLKEAVEPLLAELGKIGRQGLTDAVAAEKKKDISSIFSELFASHFKQTALAKWTRNMISQCTKLWARSKAAKADVEISKEVQEQLGMNFNYKNYKTLINTGLVAGVPLLGTIIAIPYAFNAWLTSIQKKAGKIGIMKAMDKIDDPRVFASEIQPQTEPQPLKLNNQAANSGNLLEKVKQQAV